jgi:hypothetical protein
MEDMTKLAIAPKNERPITSKIARPTWAQEMLAIFFFSILSK